MEMYYAFIAGVLIGMLAIAVVNGVRAFFNWRRSSSKWIKKWQEKHCKDF